MLAKAQFNFLLKPSLINEFKDLFGNESTYDNFVRERVNKTILRVAHKIALNIRPVRHQRTVAIIYNKRYIVSIGIAQMKTHPFQKKHGGENKPYLHAEVHAILSAMKMLGQDLTGMSMYVHRINSRNKIDIAMPCSTCRAVMTSVGMDFYHTDWSKK